MVGVKAEVERSRRRGGIRVTEGEKEDVEMSGGEEEEGTKGKGEESWVEVSIEIPSMRDDDALPVFLGQMLTEALLADGGMIKDRLWINERFHWRLYIDVRRSPQTQNSERVVWLTGEFYNRSSSSHNLSLTLYLSSL